jgi:hypothetical protein
MPDQPGERHPQSGVDGVCLRRQGDVDKLFDVEVRIAAFLADGTESNRLIGLKYVLRCRISEGEC